MANPEHLAKLKEGVEAWNQWREENLSVVPDLSGAELMRGELRGTYLRGADLREATLTGADVSGGNLFEANLSGANLSWATLREATLREATLRGANLREANLNGANLRQANLREADLGRANLSEANLLRADLGGANLSGADLSMAKLYRASLSMADLGGANLSGADLSAADLSGATFGAIAFGGTRLRGAIGLDSCIHYGRSYLDYFTLRDSWPLPLAFLRGCGLPDPYIEYLPGLLNQAIQFYSCFMSYSTEDQEFADRLYADLQNKGVRCWFAPHHIQGGKKIDEQIEEAIRVYERLLLIISEHSMSSRWVKTEIANARKKELEQKRQVLFPIRLVSFEAIRAWKLFDADIGDSAASEIREYFIPDFSNWHDHNSYKQAFDRLLRDLKAQPAEDAASAAP